MTRRTRIIQKAKKVKQYGLVRKRLRKGIRYILPSKNALQPSKEQAAYIKPIRPQLKELSMDQWYFWVMTDVKSDLFHNKQDKWNDHVNRATHIAHTLHKSPKITKIILMDGHGRIIVTLCGILLQMLGVERANSLTIKVVDNYRDSDGNQSVTDWHHNIEFDNMESSQESLFEHIPDERTFVYANFCGTGGKSGNVKLFKWMQKINHFDNLMVSFSYTRKAKIAHYMYNTKRILEKGHIERGWQKGMFGKWNAELVTVNKQCDFFTYMFNSFI